MSAGGKREGAGRPPIDPQMVKIPIGYKLPRWLVEWLRERKIITKGTAMEKKFGIRKTLNAGSKTCPGSYMWFMQNEIGITKWTLDPHDAKKWPSRIEAKNFLTAKNLRGRIVEIR